MNAKADAGVDEVLKMEQALAAGRLEAGTLRDKLDTATRLLRAWWISEAAAHVHADVRSDTQALLERVHQPWRSRDLLRRLVRKWNASEGNPRTGGGEVDMDLLRELADAFEQEEGPQR